MSDAERAALEALGYSEAWLAAGVLTPGLLAEQHARLQAGGTKKTAKYRAQALAAWRERGEPISDAQIDAFLALVCAEPDARLAQSAIAELIQAPQLRMEQLERIAQSDAGIMRRHEVLIRRSYLKRRLDQGVTDELVGRVLDFQDASLQTSLVRDPRLTRKQAEQLAKRGANPTIRENAQAWCQDKKAWK